MQRSALAVAARMTFSTFVSDRYNSRFWPAQATPPLWMKRSISTIWPDSPSRFPKTCALYFPKSISSLPKQAKVIASKPSRQPSKPTKPFSLKMASSWRARRVRFWSWVISCAKSHLLSEKAASPCPFTSPTPRVKTTLAFPAFNLPLFEEGDRKNHYPQIAPTYNRERRTMSTGENARNASFWQFDRCLARAAQRRAARRTSHRLPRRTTSTNIHPIPKTNPLCQQSRIPTAD